MPRLRIFIRFCIPSSPSSYNSSRLRDLEERRTEDDGSSSLESDGYPAAKDEQMPMEHPVPDYKLVALKWPFLVVLNITVMVLMILTAVALSTLPTDEESSRLQNRQPSTEMIEEPLLNMRILSSADTYINLQKTSASYNSSTTQEITVVLSTMLSVRSNEYPGDHTVMPRAFDSNRLAATVSGWPSSHDPHMGLELSEASKSNERAATTQPPTLILSEDDDLEHLVTTLDVRTLIRGGYGGYTCALWKREPVIVAGTIINSDPLQHAGSCLFRTLGTQTVRETNDLKLPDQVTQEMTADSTPEPTNDIAKVVPVTKTSEIAAKTEATHMTETIRLVSDEETSVPTTRHHGDNNEAGTRKSIKSNRVPTQEQAGSVTKSVETAIADTPHSADGIVGISPTIINMTPTTGTFVGDDESPLGQIQPPPSFITTTNSIGMPIVITRFGAVSEVQVPTSSESFGSFRSAETHMGLTRLPFATATDSDELPSTTNVNTMTATPTDTQGSPAATPSVKLSVYIITEEQYFVGMFLPTLLATAISILIGILERSVKLLHPFHVLTRPGGACAAASLLVKSGSPGQMMTTFRRPFKDNLVLILVTALVPAGVFLTPFSSEAINIQLHGCEQGSRVAGNCAITLGANPMPTKATIALLAFILVMLLLVTLLLKDWKSGVASHPWSLASMASLSTNPALRHLVLESSVDIKVLHETLQSAVFRIKHWRSERGELEYGICPDVGEVIGFPESPLLPLTEVAKKRTEQRSTPPIVDCYWRKSLFLAFLCGTLALIIYYQSGAWDNPFEDFMDSESFGVRFLFTSIGVIISLFWKTFTDSVAAINPFRTLASAPTDAYHSILLTPPADPFTSLWAGVQRKDYYFVAVALSTIMSQFLPMLLSNVPAATVQTMATNLGCSWAVVGILVYMIAVLVGSFFVRWPQLPIDPTTIFGMMYYVCDSPIIHNFQGLGALERKERDRKVQAMGLRYAFGEMRGVSGRERIGVYIAEDQDHSSESV
ncbi:hypothetical protein F4677DRAFT_373943 [Hypoxylon crocopeplum]|nr:hypothetical protein F4677DRAFT_373943 [Hypoxylon crocopeplum]